MLKHAGIERADGLVQDYNLPQREANADACQLCYETRRDLRERFLENLAPDQVYDADLP